MNSTRKLLIFTALAEGATGVVLFVYPPIIVQLLFGEPIAGAGLILGRLAGICLLALAVACWPATNSLRALYGMLVWSVLAALCLAVVGFRGTAGVLLWPMIGVHVALGALLARAWGRERRAVTSGEKTIRSNPQ